MVRERVITAIVRDWDHEKQEEHMKEAGGGVEKRKIRWFTSESGFSSKVICWRGLSLGIR